MDELHVPLDKVRQLSPRDFVRHKLYVIQKFEESFNQHPPLHWQLAGVSFQLYMLRHQVAYLFAKNPPTVTAELKDFLVNVKLIQPEGQKQQEEVEPEPWNEPAKEEALEDDYPEFEEFKLPVYRAEEHSQAMWLTAVNAVTPPERKK